MPKVTQRDVAESAAGLQKAAYSLRSAAAGQPIGNVPGSEHDPAVAVSAKALTDMATYLETVADELFGLLPEQQIKVPK
jgi:hypothetical protein